MAAAAGAAADAAASADAAFLREEHAAPRDEAQHKEDLRRLIAGHAAVQAQNAELRAQNAALREEVVLHAQNARLRAAAAPRPSAGHGPAAANDDGAGSPLALAVRRYEHTLSQHVSLSFFVPLLIGHGGNAGGMSVGATIAAIAKGRVSTRKAAMQAALQEVTAGALVALALAVPVAVALLTLGFEQDVTAVVVLALAAITALSALVGAVFPLVLDHWQIDAATVAPPAVTTLIDGNRGVCRNIKATSSIGIGLVIYLSFAQLFLSTGAAPAGHGHGAEL
ncbi:hypothetical protein M885DRAFT_624354 [Pelagophyceae sp. CCMP2097]|nr:hypothetical protein M885DRAFT_624354 [Pelagophyceae sp. CCMP2097]